MGLVSNFAVIGAVICTAILAVSRIIVLLVVLRGTKPQQRAALIRAVAQLFRSGATRRPRNRT